MILNSPYITGSLTVTGNIIASGSITISGSIASSSYAVSASEASRLQGLGSASFAPASTFNTVSQSYAASSASLSTRVTNEEATSSVLTSASSSFATMSGSLSTRVTIIEGQDATTGSNNFTGVQYISNTSNAISFTSTASLYTDGGFRVAKDSFVSGTAYFNNITVYGTSSIQYITSSQVNIGSNIITVNTDTPAIRFGGLSVFDSGSTQLTGSLFWDSEKNHWIYSNPSGSSYNSGMIMSGPRNSGSLGDEQGTTFNALMKGQGGDHITSSQIIDDGTTVRIPGALQVTGSLVGTSATFTGSVNITGSLIVTTTAPELQVGATGVTLGNVLTDVHQITGSLRITGSLISNGNVGIGVANPTVPLDVNGYGRVTGIGLNSSPTSIGTNPNYVRLTNTGGDFYVGQEGNTGGSFFIGSLAYDSVLYSGRPYNFIVNGVSRMYISGSGAVGIGTTSPNKSLEILSTSEQLRLSYNSSTYSEFRSDSAGGLLINAGASYIINYISGSEKMRITSAGNVGIGTNSPLAISGYISLTIGNNAANSVGLLKFRSTYNSGDGAEIYQNTSGTTFINANGSTPAMAIASSGNVGIGTNSPSTKLHVIQSLGNDAFAIGETGSNMRFRIGQEASYTGNYINSTNIDLKLITYLDGGSGGNMYFYTSTNSTPVERLRITSGGTVQPGANGTQDLGTSSLRWATVYTSDLDMSNGVGDYTIVEGEEDLFLYNNKTNKVFKFVIQEVDPSEATPKMKK